MFSFSVKSLEYPPIVADSDQLDLAVDPLLDRMLRGTPRQVPRMTREIDRRRAGCCGPKSGPDPAGPSQSSD